MTKRKNLTNAELRGILADRIRDKNTPTPELLQLVREDAKLTTRRRKPRNPAAKAAAINAVARKIEADARSQPAVPQAVAPKQNHPSAEEVSRVLRTIEPQSTFYRSSNTQQQANTFYPEILD